MLLILFFICDYFEAWDGTPFYYMGRNSILIYLFHTICDGVPWDWECQVIYDLYSRLYADFRLTHIAKKCLCAVPT